jgi:hypothetical protein
LQPQAGEGEVVKLPGYRRKKIAKGVTQFSRLPAGKHTQSHYDTDQPWICWHFGLTSDTLWPPWRSTRLLGHMKVVMECAVCGDRQLLTIPMPRFGEVKVPAGGKHPERLRYMLDHLHRDRPSPMAWAKPLLNLAAHRKGIDLNALAMRLEADLAAAEETKP